MTIGIDYGLGMTNIDHATHIRYGVISQNSVMQAWADSGEPVYPRIEVEDPDTSTYAEIEIDWGNMDPIGWEYNEEGYQLTDCLDSDIMIIQSPHFTYAPFCSLCVPGAGDLDTAGQRYTNYKGTDTLGHFAEVGVKTYCLDVTWFDSEEPCPYPYWNVTTGALEYQPKGENENGTD